MAKHKEKLSKNQIMLFSDLKKPETIRLKQVVNLYKHDSNDIERNIEYMLDFISKHICDGLDSIYTVGQYVRFRLYKDSEIHKLPLGIFLFNYILWSPNLVINRAISETDILVTTKLTNGVVVEYINKNIIYSNRDKVTFYELCEHIQFIKTKLNRVCKLLGNKIMMSLSLFEFISVMKHDKEAKKSLTCSFDIPKNITPGRLEKLINQRTRELLKTIEGRSDLNISTYAKNGLFNEGQFKEFGCHMSFKPDLVGNTIPFTSNTNILMGINDVNAFTVDARGGRKAEVLKLNVSDAGEFERTLNALLAKVRYVDENYICDSKHFVEKVITTRDEIMNNDGRVYTLDPDSDEYYIIDPYDDSQNIIGKKIYMKSPITCTHPRREEGYICKACYGYLLSSINTDIHIGRLSSLESSDQMQQKLLSAKHALVTKTKEIQFDSNFYTYFKLNGTQIMFHDELCQEILEDLDGFDNTVIEFNLSDLKKNRDGEGMRYDRSISEIVIHDKKADSRVLIKETTALPIYLTPSMSELFLDYFYDSAESDCISIPFNELVTKEGEEFAIFELRYRNDDLADPLFELTGVLGKGAEINAHAGYNELLSRLIPLFNRGGIYIPHIHIELIVSALIFDKETGNRVDWNESDVNYEFKTLDKAILNSDSVWASLLYRETSKQISGGYGTYEKRGTSIYDVFISEE